MQLAHPLVAEGVAAHSDFINDPWSRLRGTLASYLGIVFGTPSAVATELARLRTLHAKVVGPVLDPEARAISGVTSYDARDPALLLWVHATLVDSTLETYRRWGEPRGPVDADAFYAETLPLGRAFGIPAALLPPDLQSFTAYLARMLAPDGPIRVTSTARALAQTVLHPPLAPLAPRLAPLLRRIPAHAYDWSIWPALELLPDAVRDGYGIVRSAHRRAVSRWLVAGWRASYRHVPTRYRWMAQARRADRRLAIVHPAATTAIRTEGAPR